MLFVNEVRKDYDRKTAIQNIHLKVQRGEIHGLVGENGAGKTTLLKCLAGIYRPDQGTISYDDVPVYDTPQTKQRVAYVSDTQDFISLYSVQGIVKLYQNFFDHFSRERFDELNEIFGLNMHKTVGTLSKGQKMRLAFMLAVAQNAEYLLLDEPTGGLDAKSRSQLKDILIEETEKRNLGVIISSHDLNGMEMLCDQVTMLKRGEIILQKPLDDVMNLVQKWQTVFVHRPEADRTGNSTLNGGLRLHAISSIGNMTTMLTIGDREENRERLIQAGAQELTSLAISLEEIFLTLNEAESEACL